MPKRILDDSILDSRSMEVLTPAAQDAFPRFILLADDFGCFEVNPVILRARGWSRRPDVTEGMVEAWITEYAERQASNPETGGKLAPVLMLWTHVGRRYAYLTGWHGPHGQKRRAEYDPNAPAKTPERHGSKRKTPPPPGEMLASVMAGNVRPVDGKPPGTDRELTGDHETGKTNDSLPARELTGKPPGTDRETCSSRSVPGPAVPVAVPDAGAVPAGRPDNARSLGDPRSEGAVARLAILGRDEAFASAHPRTSALLDALQAAGAPGAWPRSHDARVAVEAAIGAQDPATVAGRVAEAIRATSKPWLGNHLDVIRSPTGGAGGPRRIFEGFAADGFTPVYRESQ